MADFARGDRKLLFNPINVVLVEPVDTTACGGNDDSDASNEELRLRIDSSPVASPILLTANKPCFLSDSITLLVDAVSRVLEARVCRDVDASDSARCTTS